MTDNTLRTFVLLAALSALFMGQAISNDYVANVSIRAITDWVITQPTKQFYVNSESTPPYTTSWDGTSACETVAPKFWGRDAEEIELAAGPTFSVRPPFSSPEDTELCTQVTVIGFGQSSAVRSTDDIFYGVNGFLGGYTSGFAEIDFGVEEARSLPTADGGSMVGLPVIGYTVITYRNDDANEVIPGVLAAFASTTEHKRTRRVEPAGGE